MAMRASSRMVMVGRPFSHDDEVVLAVLTG